jgi:ABC-type branched-subunit amino acid transport system ATPase component
MRVAPPAPPAELTIEAITVRFGGLVAVDDVSLEGKPGTITGLMGPNGAGKTTTFNACTGLVRPARGTVRLEGRRLDHHSPARRASWGLGRTFQRMVLFDSMTAAQNVAMGLECRYAGRGWWAQITATPSQRAMCRDTAADSMERCGIAHLAHVLAGDLSTGQRRLVELARAVTGRFRFLLLDEPSSGLDESETVEFGRVLLDLVERDGTGILLVEHDMALVRDVCSYIYVLDFGRQIFEGTTAEVMASDIVRSAYLGSEAESSELEAIEAGVE